VRFVYTDGREEVVSAGEMYYVPAGHTFEVLEDTETVEFSPTAEYRRHMATVAKNMGASRDGQ
jgi:mannose-6-phosphate isomerase-like protein (cupin superfamily)